MRHVLVYSRQFPTPDSLSDGLFTAQLVKALAKKVRVTVIVPMPMLPWKGLQYENSETVQYMEGVVKWDYYGIPVYIAQFLHFPVLTRPFQACFQSYRLSKLVERINNTGKINLINAHFAFPDGVAAEIIGRKLEIPVLVTAMGTDINEYRYNSLYRRQITRHLALARGVSGKSRALVDAVIELGVARDKAFYTPNGVDLERFSAQNLSCETARRTLSLDEEGKYLLFVGRLHGVKGLEYLLPAIDLLKRDGKLSFKLLVVGEGPLREWIEKYVEKNGLLDNVFIAGAQPHSAMQFWYAAADGFCLPSKAEGLPNVIIESLALGIPVVASDVGGIPDLVNEKNGYLVDAGDVKGLAYAIESMMNRNWTKDEVMSACQFLSWEEAANRYIDIYESLIDAGGV